MSKCLAGSIDGGVIRITNAKKPEEFARQVAPNDIALDVHSEIDNPIIVVGSGLPKDDFGSIVMVVRIKDGGIGPIVGQIPPRETASGLLNIYLGIVAAPKGKKLSEFAGVVLVRRYGGVAIEVQKNHHCRVAPELLQQRAEITQRMADQQVLPTLEAVIAIHFLGRDHQMSVQKERHFIEQGTRAIGQLQVKSARQGD